MIGNILFLCWCFISIFRCYSVLPCDLSANFCRSLWFIIRLTFLHFPTLGKYNPPSQKKIHWFFEGKGAQLYLHFSVFFLTNFVGAEISQMISENAFVCIYLVSQLTKLVSITGTVASMAGSTHRFILTIFYPESLF